MSLRAPGVRRRIRLAAQVVIVALVGWFVARALRDQWGEFRRLSASLDPDWGLLAASAAIVLATYALLIEVWRRLVAGEGRPVPLPRAAHVWFVSSLGKYVPGKVWAIAAMGALAQREGISPGLAAFAAILNQAVNIAAGFAVVAISGASGIEQLFPNGRGRVALGVAAVAGVGLLALPMILPAAAAAVARRTGRAVAVGIPPAALWFAIGANVAAWVLYGVAFRLFAVALGAGGALGWAPAVAVFTASYLVGYLALFVPGGLVVREATMFAALTGLGLTTAPQATLLAVASRLWLTVLEVVPGVLLAVRDAASRSSPSRS